MRGLQHGGRLPSDDGERVLDEATGHIVLKEKAFCEAEVENVIILR